MTFNLIVLRAAEPEKVAAFYEALGLRFNWQRHGAGDEHLSCDLNGFVFEIYPRSVPEKDTRGTRLGLSVDDVDAACERALAFAGRLLSAPKLTTYGRRAVLADPEGHSVELVQSGT